MNSHAAEPDDEDEDPAGAPSGPPSVRKNYMTPEGHAGLRAELLTLLATVRPQVVDIVSWAASNGDRSENGDYLYGKKRLREIDRRIRFLTRRLEGAVVVDATVHRGQSRVFFGATVQVMRDTGETQTVTILGQDEADSARGQISWVSPLAQALLGQEVGQPLRLRTPKGWEAVEIVAVAYPEAGQAAASLSSGGGFGAPASPTGCGASDAAHRPGADGPAPK